MERKVYWYWLCNLNQIGNKKITELLNWFDSPESIYLAKEAELKKINILNSKDVQTILLEKNIDKLKGNFAKLKEKGVEFITRDDSVYPTRLRNIYDAPMCLYVRGKLPAEEKVTIAVVGARNCSNYGKEVAIHFANKLATAGIQIVSGLARGIDGYAHTGALETSESTYGVLGCGIDICYPTAHIEMFMQMQKHGGILSEYGLGVYPKKGYFPMRNRLISGLSDGILVIEAKEKSGSLITVDCGLEQGKDIFAIPGRVTDELSCGCNNLIKMGAELVNTPEDILKAYNIKTSTNVNELRKKEGLLEGKEKKLYASLGLIPKHINHIAKECDLSISDVMETLLRLELKEYIKQTTKNYYVILI